VNRSSTSTRPGRAGGALHVSTTREPTASEESFVRHERKRGWSALGLRELGCTANCSTSSPGAPSSCATAGRQRRRLAALNPLLTMVIFTVVFNIVLGVKSPSRKALSVFSYSGLLPWNFFPARWALSGMSRR